MGLEEPKGTNPIEINELIEDKQDKMGAATCWSVEADVIVGKGAYDSPDVVNPLVKQRNHDNR